MKKTIALTLIVTILTSVSYSQSLSFEIGEAISSFDYRNSSGNSIELQPVAKTYLGLGYHQELGKHIKFISALNYNHFGATGNKRIINNDFAIEWDLHFLAASLGANMFWKKNFLTIYSELSFSYEYLVVGNQFVNEVKYNLINQEEFNNQFFFYKGAIGASYELTRTTDLFIQYTYGRSLPLRDKTPLSNEKLIIQAHKIGIGMLIDIAFFKRGSYFRPKF